MKKFKIGYFGDGPWAHEAFKKIMSDKSLQIDFVCVRYDLRDPILIQLAEENKVDILIDKNINAKEFMTKVSKYKSDLFVSMSFNQIFKRTI
ncbi:MAG: methionyl-tRNA formyltransferase, partial [Eubacterium sp.]